MLDRDFIAAHADGADEFLAAAAEWSLERAAEVTGLAAADIATLAEWWGTTRPTMLRIGWGQERNANGGAACRAILALPVLGGHFGQPGSGVIGSTSTGAAKPRQRWPQEAFDGPQRRDAAVASGRPVDGARLRRPCEVLFVQGANPLVMCPDQQAVIAAFSRDDVFTVVHEQVLTDTTRYADVVLPATTSFEIDDVTSGYGSLMVMPVARRHRAGGREPIERRDGPGAGACDGFDWSAAGASRSPSPIPARASRRAVPTVRRHVPDGRAGADWSTPCRACRVTSPLPAPRVR